MSVRGRETAQPSCPQMMLTHRLRILGELLFAAISNRGQLGAASGSGGVTSGSSGSVAGSGGVTPGSSGIVSGCPGSVSGSGRSRSGAGSYVVIGTLPLVHQQERGDPRLPAPVAFPTERDRPARPQVWT